MQSSTPEGQTTRSETQAARRSIAKFWAGSVLVAILLSPLGPWLASWIWPCPLKTFTGIPCPLCGTTRAALLLARFEIWEAWVRFPLPTALWSFWVIGGSWAGGWLLSGRELPALQWPRKPVWGVLLLGLVVANWIYSILTGV